jgi:MarR family transcriptional regulator, organic hydroperoxide resistance regulator
VKNKAIGSYFANSLYFSAGALAREAEKLAIACWGPVGLSPSHAQIILFLLDFSITGPSIIARTLLLSPSTITRLLDGLERKGLIVRFVYHEVRMVSPSEEARAREEEFLECDLEFSRRCTKLLGDEHPSGLTREMNKATDKLRGVDKGDRPDGDTESGQ